MSGWPTMPGRKWEEGIKRLTKEAMTIADTVRESKAEKAKETKTLRT